MSRKKGKRPTQEQERESLLNAWSPTERVRLQNRARVLYAAGRMPEEIAEQLSISVEEAQAFQRYNRDQIAFLLTDDGMRDSLINELAYLQEAQRRWAGKALERGKDLSADKHSLMAHRVVVDIFAQRRDALSWGRTLPPSDAQVAGSGVTEAEIEAMSALATEAEKAAIQAGDESVMARLLAEARSRIRGESRGKVRGR